MFIVSVYDLAHDAKEVLHYGIYHFADALKKYIAFSESFNPEHYGVLLYSDNGDIIYGFGEEV